MRQLRRLAHLLFIACFLPVAGCSLVKIENPAQPLPERDLNARTMTRDYALAFGTAVAIKANEVMADAESVDQKVAALTWKMSAATSMAVTATQLSPMLSLLDTWTYVLQMDSFLRAAENASLFGAHRESVLDMSGQKLSEIRDLARRLSTRAEFAQYSDAVSAHAAENPMTSVGMVRVSLATSPAVDDLPGVPLQTVGTAAEAMSDAADRLRLYTIILRYSTQWQIELYALQSGFSEGDIAAAMQRMDGHFSELATFARQSPLMMEQATADLERIMLRSSGELEQSALAIIAAIQAERELLMSDLDQNWDRVYVALDTQRSAAAADLERIALGVNNEMWSNLRSTARELALYLIVFLVLLLTLPFVGGYFVGKARARNLP